MSKGHEASLQIPQIRQRYAIPSKKRDLCTILPPLSAYLHPEIAPNLVKDILQKQRLRKLPCSERGPAPIDLRPQRQLLIRRAPGVVVKRFDGSVLAVEGDVVVSGDCERGCWVGGGDEMFF